ncbi:MULTISPECIES: hypothetical protein [Streptomyces]|uniref:hypothetical protein n=1 Tax=Streptomyces TaxID=1883 RepID=UPI0038F695EF
MAPLNQPAPPGHPARQHRPLSRTTLCVAGYAAHLTGHALEVVHGPSDSHGSRATHTVAHKPGSHALPVRGVAKGERHLTGNDVGRLFASCTAASTVLAALGQLAGGARRIDWAAVQQ